MGWIVYGLYAIAVLLLLPFLCLLAIVVILENLSLGLPVFTGFRS